MPLSKKEEILSQLGVDTFYIVKFDKEFASLLPEQFVTEYLRNLGIVHAVAGFDFTYGYKGVGHIERLKRDSSYLIDVTKVEKLEFYGEKISSTCIREKLLKGNVDEVFRLLGRPYEVECDWDGNSLTLHRYYRLPGPGCYDVTFKNKTGSIKTKVIVLEKLEGLFLKCMEDFPELIEGKLSIVWNRSILEDRVSGCPYSISIPVFDQKREYISFVN